MKIWACQVIALCCLTAILAVAQESGIEGTWVSNPPDAVTIKFKVDAKKNKLSGTITQMVTKTEYDIEDGQVTGKTFTFSSIEVGNSKATPIPWKGELKDPNTVTLIRLSAAGQPVGNALVLHRAAK